MRAEHGWNTNLDRHRDSYLVAVACSAGDTRSPETRAHGGESTMGAGEEAARTTRAYWARLACHAAHRTGGEPAGARGKSSPRLATGASVRRSRDRSAANC